MTTDFTEFELDRWNDAGVCSAYRDCLGPLVTQAVRPLLQAAQLEPGCKVLDVATGTGLVAAAAAAHGAWVIGSDFSAEQLVRARTEHPDLVFESGNAGALPYPAGAFDVVVSNFGVPQFPDPGAFLGESRRVLRGGGRLAFTVWAEPARAKAYEAILGAVEKFGAFDVGLPPGPDVFLYADSDIARTGMTAAGFWSVEVRTIEQIWDVSDPDDVFTGIRDGTARTSALLERQEPEAATKIRAAVAEAMARHRDGDRYRIPMPAVLVSGIAGKQ